MEEPTKIYLIFEHYPQTTLDTILQNKGILNEE